MADSIWVRTQGGAVIKMDRPLPAAVQEWFDAGQIGRVNEDGTPWTDDSDNSEPDAPGSDTDDTTGGDDTDDGDDSGDGGDDTPPPPHSAPKAEWVDYAVQVGGLTRDEATALTKAELIDRYGN